VSKGLITMSARIGNDEIEPEIQRKGPRPQKDDWAIEQVQRVVELSGLRAVVSLGRPSNDPVVRQSVFARVSSTATNGSTNEERDYTHKKPA
jgi:hypothetical protein